MKILYQSTSFIPSYSANSIHVMSMVDEFVAMGNDVVLLGLFGNIETSVSDYKYYGVGNTFNIYKFNYSSIFNKIKYLFGSISVAKKFKPDVIVSRSHVGAFLFLFFGFKVILDAHRPVWSGSFLKKCMWNYFRKCENLRVTTNSCGLKQMFKESKVLPSHEITVAFNGSKMFPLDKLYFVKGDRFNVGYVGGLYQGRGVDIILKIAECLPNINFHIAGGSKDDIVTLTEKYHVSDNVIFHGHVDPSDVYMFRNSCDILLAPYHKIGVGSFGSHFDDQSKYQNPIKVIEYLSANKPIIASDIKSIREILDESKAILVDPDKISDWVDAIEILIGNRDLYNSYAKNGYDFFINNLTWKARAKKMLSLAKDNLL